MCFAVMRIEENLKIGVSLNITFLILIQCDASIFQLLHSDIKNKDLVRIFFTAFYLRKTYRVVERFGIFERQDAHIRIIVALFI